MDKFLLKTASVSTIKSENKSRSHLPVNISSKNRARKYPEGTFFVDDGLFCSSCNIVIDHLRKSVIENHLKADVHKKNVNRINQTGKQQEVKNGTH
jgi:hypothetical protein